MLILISYNFTGFFTVDLYIVNWYVLKSDDCPYGHVISVYCYLCVCLCLQGIFPNLWYACTRYMEGNKLNWIQIECRVYVCQRNSRLLQRHVRDVILLPQTFTDITLWRVAVALAAILVPYFCSRSVIIFRGPFPSSRIADIKSLTTDRLQIGNQVTSKCAVYLRESMVCVWEHRRETCVLLGFWFYAM